MTNIHDSNLFDKLDRMDKMKLATSNKDGKAQMRTKNKAIDLQPQWKVLTSIEVIIS